MSFNCPLAPVDARPGISLETYELPAGAELHRFHGNRFPAESFNPNTNRRIEVAEDGARFNPFPGAPTPNVPTLYAADNAEAAALESVFHDVEHAPSPRYPIVRLIDWYYSRLVVQINLTIFRLTNPKLRQLQVPGRVKSITEGELVHSQPEEYPNTRTWARYLHDSSLKLDGFGWRPRLGGMGTAYVFFGDRFPPGEIEAVSKPIRISSGAGLKMMQAIAKEANISLFDWS